MLSTGSELSDAPEVTTPDSHGRSSASNSPGSSTHSKASDRHALLEKLEQMDIELPDQPCDSIQAASATGEEMAGAQSPQDASWPPAVAVTRKRKASATAGSRSSKAVAPKKAKRGAGKYEAPFVLEDPKSPLASADLRAILLHPKAWDILTKEEKQEILGFFPDATHIMRPGTDDARPNARSLRNDNNFRHDCVRYRENLEQGKHDPDWLRSAWAAHARRTRGDYDDHMVTAFEEEWGVELPEAHYPKSLRNKQSCHDREQDYEDGKHDAGDSQQADEVTDEDAAGGEIAAAASSPREAQAMTEASCAAGIPDPATAVGDLMEAGESN